MTEDGGRGPQKRRGKATEGTVSAVAVSSAVEMVDQEWSDQLPCSVTHYVDKSVEETLIYPAWWI